MGATLKVNRKQFVLEKLIPVDNASGRETGDKAGNHMTYFGYFVPVFGQNG